jgi:hypothetical protein
LTWERELKNPIEALTWSEILWKFGAAIMMEEREMEGRLNNAPRLMTKVSYFSLASRKYHVYLEFYEPGFA